MKRKVFFAFYAFVLFSVLCFVSGAEGEKTTRKVVFDMEGYLDSAECQRVEQALLQAGQTTGCDFCVYLYDFARGEVNGTDFRREYSPAQNLILLIVTQDAGKWYYDLYTYGVAAREITDREADLLLDDNVVYHNLKSGNLVDGLVAFATVGTDMILNKHPAFFETFAGAVVLGVIFGVLAGGITVGVIVFRYKRKLKAPSYPLERYTRLNLKERSDVFLGSHVSRVRAVSSSGGGRGGSSHGGGSGHRGGR